MNTKPITLPTPRLVVDGDFGVDVAELVTAKLSRLTRHANRPILDVRVRLIRHPHPAGRPSVEVEVHLDLNGRMVRAEAAAQGARDALDRVVDRLVRQLDDRRGRKVTVMTEREEVYRASKEARTGYVARATRGSRSATDAIQHLVDAAVYRYEHDKVNEETESTGDGDDTAPADR